MSGLQIEIIKHVPKFMNSAHSRTFLLICYAGYEIHVTRMQLLGDALAEEAALGARLSFLYKNYQSNYEN